MTKKAKTKASNQKRVNDNNAKMKGANDKNDKKRIKKRRIHAKHNLQWKTKLSAFSLANDMKPSGKQS